MQTRKFKVEKSFGWNGQITEKVTALMKMFGLDLGRLKKPVPVVKCEIELRSGDICYITGASGAGKSVLLKELYNAVEKKEKIKLEDIKIKKGSALIDCIEGDALHSLRVLSKGGLSDAFSMLKNPENLSDGQKYRFRLAKALSSGKKIIFADEFCSNLDRITASVVAYNIRELANRHNLTFILASSHDDILIDLQPEMIVVNYLSGQTRVIYRDIRRQL